MRLPHPCGVIGLAFNTIGSRMLIWYPSDAKVYQADGSWNGWFHVSTTAAGKSYYRRLIYGFRFALLLLAAGLFSKASTY